ncbi:MAG: hypothetical protein IJC71_05345, partial [Clostridia bacterium]|nr:hypothetical protein [Clostridia bacterium]
LGEGKLFAKSFPSPKPPTFQKTLKKGTEIPVNDLKHNHISVTKSLFSEVFEKREGVRRDGEKHLQKFFSSPCFMRQPLLPEKLCTVV